MELGRQSLSGSLSPGGLPDLKGCRLLVQLPGFVETIVELGRLRSQSDLDLGKLPLKAKGVEGQRMFSQRAASAPAAARRAYIHALEARSSGKPDEALREIGKALKADPGYAPALQLKGQILERTGQRGAGRAAYQQAAQADPEYVKPLVALAEMAAEDQDPEETALWAQRVNRLAPNSYPYLYFAEGAAYFNVNRFEEAERVARIGCAADVTNSFPRLRKLLGEALFRLNRYGEAAAVLKEYLALAPDAPDGLAVRQRMSDAGRLASILQR